MVSVIVAKPGALTAADRKKLREAGIVCITTERPLEVRFLQPEGPQLAPHDLLYAAMLGVAESDFSKKRFADATLALLKVARANAASAAS